MQVYYLFWIALRKFRNNIGLYQNLICTIYSNFFRTVLLDHKSHVAAFLYFLLQIIWFDKWNESTKTSSTLLLKCGEDKGLEVLVIVQRTDKLYSLRSVWSFHAVTFFLFRYLHSNIFSCTCVVHKYCTRGYPCKPYVPTVSRPVASLTRPFLGSNSPPSASNWCLFYCSLHMYSTEYPPILFNQQSSQKAYFVSLLLH